jgi:hypothetical protein
MPVLYDLREITLYTMLPGNVSFSPRCCLDNLGVVFVIEGRERSFQRGSHLHGEVPRLPIF